MGPFVPAEFGRREQLIDDPIEDVIDPWTEMGVVLAVGELHVRRSFRGHAWRGVDCDERDKASAHQAARRSHHDGHLIFPSRKLRSSI